MRAENEVELFLIGLKLRKNGVFMVEDGEKKTKIMGIINVTPDSFSGDGQMLSGQDDFPVNVVKQATEFLRNGADLLDIGGESTRPGSKAITFQEEYQRVIPCVQAIKDKFPDAVISVDTTKAKIAAEALKRGANMINDVSDGSNDAEMAQVVAEAKAWIVLMHNRANIAKVEVNTLLGNAYQATDRDDIVTQITHDLQARITTMELAGVARSKMILDPGIGFGKTVRDNLRLINQLEQLQIFAMPILLGASRKSFIGKVLNETTQERLIGSIIAAMVGKMRGASILRVHDVAQTHRAVAMLDAILCA